MFTSGEPTAETHLWIAFLWQAAYNFHGRNNIGAGPQRSAKEWFYSQSREPGSYLWLISLLPGEINPYRLRKQLLAEAKPREKRRLKPADYEPEVVTTE